MACLPPGPEDLEYWRAECPLSGPDGSAILLHPAESGLGLPWKGQLFEAETDYEGVVIGDCLLPRIPTNGASICISTSLIIFQLITSDQNSSQTGQNSSNSSLKN